MRRFILLIVMLMLLLPAASALGQDDGTIRHVVQPGENLFRISLRYQVSMSNIVAANPIIRNPNLIYAGTTLVIPKGGVVPTPAPGDPTPQPGNEQQYTVVRGDTLGRIAQRFGTTVAAIAQRNGIANPNLIFVGQVLIIPGTTGGPTQPPPAATPEPGPPPTTGGFELGGQVFGFQYAAQMQGAGMTWVKQQLSFHRGDSPSNAQGLIDQAHNQGFKILLSVLGEPGELAPNPTQYYQEFASFLGGVAALGPDAIEVWNEQNIDREWPNGQISPQAYTQMLSTSYNAIKGQNNSVLVISGAPAPTGFFAGGCTNAGCDDLPFIQGMAASGAGSYFDCLGIHYNEGILSPDATSGDPRGNSGHYTRYYPSMVSTYSGVFPSKPLCFTELGYLSPEGYGPLPASFSWAANVTVQDQATWLARAATRSRDGGRVRLMIVWNVDATQYGTDPQAGYAIIRPNNTCLACNTLGAALGG